MKKIVIFGNSGSGKSTLAHEPCAEEKLAHLDLDGIAWKPGMPPERRSLEDSGRDIADFTESHLSWVIEGCYSDLLALVIPQATELIFLDLSVEDCIANARQRPWEPHKYATKAAQDANLAMLLDWIAQYAVREDTFSRTAHEALFACFNGPKTRFTDNHRVQ